MRAGLRPPLKLHVHFSRMQLSRRLSFRDAKEGINPIRLTSPWYSVFLGSHFQPPFLQRLYRCDQIRRTIHCPSQLMPAWREASMLASKHQIFIFTKEEP